MCERPIIICLKTNFEHFSARISAELIGFSRFCLLFELPGQETFSSVSGHFEIEIADRFEGQFEDFEIDEILADKTYLAQFMQVFFGNR